MTNSALDHIATAYDVLADGPHAPAVPADITDTLAPAHPGEVAAILYNRSTSPTKRDRIWAHIVGRTRTDNNGEWTVIATGLALPGLRRAAARTARIWPHDDPGDTDAEVLAGFVAALSEVDLARPRICSRLVQAAFSAGRAAARRHIRAAQTRQRALESSMPPPVSGHVDLVLARAVHEGIITRADAEIIGATRLDHQPLVEEAATQGLTLAELQQIRDTAETALRNWITGEHP